MANIYGNRYPRSGTADPYRKGPEWHPMPEGMLERTPIVECRTVREEPGFLRKLVGLQGNEAEVCEIVGEKVTKHYR